MHRRQHHKLGWFVHREPKCNLFPNRQLCPRTGDERTNKTWFGLGAVYFVPLLGILKSVDSRLCKRHCSTHRGLPAVCLIVFLRSAETRTPNRYVALFVFCKHGAFSTRSFQQSLVPVRSVCELNERFSPPAFFTKPSTRFSGYSVLVGTERVRCRYQKMNEALRCCGGLWNDG